ncbi:MAG: KH domain-containing protein [Candidatus Woesearchaeota archaeon]
MTSPPQQYHYELRIPKERVAILIGKGGETKQHLEQHTQASIQVDSQEGDVHITGSDVILLFQLREIIKAVGRGFNPDIAIQLLKSDYSFELISLNDYSKHKNHQQRMKGRVIGKAGKTRGVIEQLTQTNISVYGKTIGVIGVIEQVGLATKAIDMLLQGSPHANVYKWLEKKTKHAFEHDIEVREGFEKYVE